MKLLLVLLIFVTTLVSCNSKRAGDLTPADMRKAVQRAKIQQKIDSMEFANQMWVLENKYQTEKKRVESSLLE